MGIGSTTKTYSNALLGFNELHVVNQPGTIDGVTGGAADAFGIPNLVLNFGLIADTAQDGLAVDLDRNGFVLNAGTIDATGVGGVGVRIVSVAAGGSGAVVVNAGTISGTLDGVDLPAGGLVIDAIGGLIEGGRYGIDVSGGPGTIVDVGTITGGTDAIAFSGHFTDRVTLGRGAVLHGQVVGGSGTNTLELAATPGGTGTLSAFDGEFVGFGTVAVDRGAHWALAQPAVIGSGTTLTDAGTLSNLGRIDTTVAIGSGGSLDNSGEINAAAGSFGNSESSAGRIGVLGASQAAVTNVGLISGGLGASGVYAATDGGAGVSLSVGSLTNSGTILGGEAGSVSSLTAVLAGAGGVGVTLSAGAVSNDGTIVGGRGGSHSGYAFTAYGSGGAGGIGIVLSAGTLANHGTIAGGSGGIGPITGGAGGDGATLSAATVTNDGTISGGFGGYGGLAGGAGGIGLALRSGMLLNAGLIAGGVGGVAGAEDTGGAGGIGVILQSTATLANGGTIDGGAGDYQSVGGAGVVLQAGGVLGNTGLIAGGTGGPSAYFDFAGAGGIGVDLQASGTVENSGTILGGAQGIVEDPSGAIAIALEAGGSIVNAAGALIGSPGYVGISVSGGAGTITNAGTISSGSSPLFPGQSYQAITFSGSFADRVILDPGAVLNGQVIGGTGTNTLELAAGSLGSTGTVSSFGTEFTSFGTITLDAGASWLLDGAAPTGQAVALVGGSHVLSLNDTAGFADPIGGFASTDALDLRDVAYAADAKATLSGSTLTVSSGTDTDTLKLLGLSAGTTFGVGNDGAGHVLIDETVSPTAGYTAAASLRFLAGSEATSEHAVFSAQAAHAAMTESLQAFMRLSPVSAAWSGDIAAGFHAPLHAMSPAIQLVVTDQSDKNGEHSAWLHHVS